MAERPELSPWAAALWVEPEFRRRGHAESLLRRALRHGAEAGFGRLRLCARPALEDFYRRRGWSLIERNVGAKKLSTFTRETAWTPA